MCGTESFAWMARVGVFELDTLEGGAGMLVLSRRQGERILVGEDITVTLVRIDKHSVRLGIEAPKHMAILREELVLTVDSDEKAAA